MHCGYDHRVRIDLDDQSLPLCLIGGRDRCCLVRLRSFLRQMVGKRYSAERIAQPKPIEVNKQWAFVQQVYRSQNSSSDSDNHPGAIAQSLRSQNWIRAILGDRRSYVCSPHPSQLVYSWFRWVSLQKIINTDNIYQLALYFILNPLYFFQCPILNPPPKLCGNHSDAEL